MQRIGLIVMLLASVLAAGCAAIGRAGARTSGLQVVDVNGCSYTTPKSPCQPVAKGQP